ncbi:MAG: hypothetical protein AB7F41_17220, partial [Methylocystis sp.]
MTPFLIAAILSGLVAFLVGTTLRPWLDNKKRGAGSHQVAALALLISAISMLLIVAIAEYIYMIITHNWIDWQYFFDGPSFKQIVFGFIFGNFLSYWLMRA